MWRKFAKVILIVFMIAAAIDSVVFMVIYGVWIGLIFLVSALIASVSFGLMIGLCTDAADSRELLAQIAYLLKSGNLKPDNSALSRLTNSSNAEKL